MTQKLILSQQQRLKKGKGYNDDRSEIELPKMNVKSLISLDTTNYYMLMFIWLQ